jgi:hypothetical protein
MAAAVGAIATAAAAAVVIGTAIVTATIATDHATPRAVRASRGAMSPETMRPVAMLRAASSHVTRGRDATNHDVTNRVARSRGDSSRAAMSPAMINPVAMNRAVMSLRAKRRGMLLPRKAAPKPMAPLATAMAMATAATWVARDSTVPRVNAANALDAHAEVAVVAVGVAPAVMAAWARMPRIMAPRMAIEPSLRVM